MSTGNARESVVSSFATHSIQNPGHMTNGRMHKCRHIGTRPAINDGYGETTTNISLATQPSRHLYQNTDFMQSPVLTAHIRGKTSLAYFIACSTNLFERMWCGRLAMYPSSMASVTSAIEPSAAVIYNDSNAMTTKWVAGLIKKVCECANKTKPSKPQVKSLLFHVGGGMSGTNDSRHGESVLARAG